MRPRPGIDEGNVAGMPVPMEEIWRSQGRFCAIRMLDPHFDGQNKLLFLPEWRLSSFRPPKEVMIWA